jgi:hypothetical protein
MYRGIDGRLRDRPAAAGDRLGAGLGGLVIDRDFGKNRHGGAPAEALLVVDASDPTRRRCRLPRASPTHLDAGDSAARHPYRRYRRAAVMRFEKTAACALGPCPPML